jgi:hypothetical protein
MEKGKENATFRLTQDCFLPRVVHDHQLKIGMYLCGGVLRHSRITTLGHLMGLQRDTQVTMLGNRNSPGAVL